MDGCRSGQSYISADSSMAHVLKFPASPTTAAVSSDAPLTFEALYRREFAFVWRSVRGFGVAAEAVDDVVQEVFVVVHRRLPSFDPTQGAVRGWIYGIARLASSRHRRTARRKDPRRLAPPPPPGPTQPDDVLARNQAANLVQLFLDNLDERYREVFFLHDVEGLSAPEIVRLLNLKLGTVYSRLRRAREQFQKYVHRHQTRDARGLKSHG